VVYIDDNEKSEKGTASIIAKSEDIGRQIARAWHRAEIKHDFDNEKNFRAAVRKNQRTLERPDAIGTLFTEGNHFFTTKVKVKDRKETLYFIDRQRKQTGRLRQQHEKGPLAKIDKRPKRHLFLEEKRFKELKKWHAKHKHRAPCFCICEERPENGKYHIEFACNGTEISGWHESEGVVNMNKRNLRPRIASALENILGIRG
jgi:hypothetical protein